MVEENHAVTSYLGRLQETAHALSSALSESQAIQIPLEQAVSALDARGALVRLLSADGDELLPAGSRGLTDAFVLSGRVDATESHLARRALAGEVVLISDVTRDPAYPHPTAAAREGLRGLIVVPMRVRAHVLGLCGSPGVQAAPVGRNACLLGPPTPL